MKVTLDLTKLLAEGKISQEEHDRLSRLGAGGTGSLAFNLLIGFGVIAVSAGLIALVPNPTTGVLLGLLVLGSGLGVYGARWTQWEVLGHICVLIGALMLGGGVIMLTLASVWAFVAIAVGFTIAGVIADSGLLIVAAVLAFSSCLGARTDYMHATYFLGIEEPTLTIVVFSAVALGAYQLSKYLPHRYERLALLAARTSILLVNLGFWIGSLWGDESKEFNFVLPDTLYVVLWAVALVATGAWAAWSGRRWVVNIVAVFAAIHFYTQWFERLEVQPITVLLAGVLALGFAIGLWYFNRALWDRSHPAKTATPS